MAERTVTIDTLITRCQQLTDTENDTHVSSTEWFSIMNSAIAETWDTIVNAGLGEKWVTSVSISVVAGTSVYDLFTAASNFYRVHAVYVSENGQLRPLRRMNPAEIQAFKAPTQACTVKLYYIPYSPVLTTGQSFDGINGWEELVLMTAACAVKLKREEDYNVFYRRKKELEQRVKSMGNVDFGEPIRVSRKRRYGRNEYSLYSNNLNGYVLRGDNIELYSYTGYVP